MFNSISNQKLSTLSNKHDFIITFNPNLYEKLPLLLLLIPILLNDSSLFSHRFMVRYSNDFNKSAILPTAQCPYQRQSSKQRPITSYTYVWVVPSQGIPPPPSAKNNFISLKCLQKMRRKKCQFCKSKKVEHRIFLGIKHYSEKKFGCIYDEYGQIRKFVTP